MLSYDVKYIPSFMGYLVNATPSSASQGLYFLKNLMITPYSTVTTPRKIRTSGSGTGGVYALAGDVITADTVLTTDKAWFVVQGQPYLDYGGQGSYYVYRELCYQVNSSGQMRIKYSPRAGFVGGSPSPSQVPSATDERVLVGGGTDGSPTFATLLPSSGYRLQATVYDTDDRFYALAYPVGGGAASMLLFLDLITPTPRGAAGNLLDKDGAVLYAATGSNCALRTDLCSEIRGPRSVLAYGDTSSPTKELWGRTPCQFRATLDASEAIQPIIPGGLPSSLLYTSPSYAQETPRYGRRSALAGTTLTGEAGNNNTCDDKGEGSLYKLSGTVFSTPTLLDAIDPASGVVSNGTLLAIGHIVLPWVGTALQL